jgi:hypothetical protein
MMPRGKNLTLTEAAAFGLCFIQCYRFLTIDQFARIARLNRRERITPADEADLDQAIDTALREVRADTNNAYGKT